MPSTNYFDEMMGSTLLRMETAKAALIALHAFTRSPHIADRGDISYCVTTGMMISNDIRVAFHCMNGVVDTFKEMLENYEKSEGVKK